MVRPAAAPDVLLQLLRQRVADGGPGTPGAAWASDPYSIGYVFGLCEGYLQAAQLHPAQMLAVIDGVAEQLAGGAGGRVVRRGLELIAAEDAAFWDGRLSGGHDGLRQMLGRAEGDAVGHGASDGIGTGIGTAATPSAELDLVLSMAEDIGPEAVSISDLRMLLPVAEASGDRRLRARAQLALGWSLTADKGADWVEATEEGLALLEAASAGFEALDDRRRRAKAEFGLGAAYSEMRNGDREANLDAAIEHLRRAEALIVDEPVERVMGIQATLSNALRRQAVFRPELNDEAVAAAQRAVDALAVEGHPVSAAMARVNLALALDARKGAGDRRRALDAYQLALEVFDPQVHRQARGQTLLNRGQSLARGEDRAAKADLQLAVRDLEEARTLLDPRSEPVLFTWCELNLGKCHARLGRWEAALRAFDAATALAQARAAGASSAAGRAAAAAEVGNLTGAAALCLVELGRLDAALERLVLGRNRMTRDMLGLEEAAADDLNLLAAAPEGGALVAPMLGYGGGAMLVVPHGVGALAAEHLVRLPDLGLDELRRLTKGRADDGPVAGGWLAAYMAHANEQAPLDEAITAVGDALGEMLAEPLRARLQALGVSGGAPLRILPQGGLGLLPFHVAAARTPAGLRYLFEDYTISQLLQVSAPASDRQPGKRAAPVRFLSIPDGSATLPFSLAETIIAPVAFGTFRATESAIVSPKPAGLALAHRGQDILHFACHGTFSWQDAGGGGLLLANGGLLTVEQVAREWRLEPGALVVLSACESGVAEVGTAPDAAVGLPAAFLAAGAEAVLCALWRVNDLATALLVTRFFETLARGEGGPAAALRDAQRWLRDASPDELATILRAWAAGLTRALGPAAFEDAIRWVEQDPSTPPFAAPEFWAGFILAEQAHVPRRSFGKPRRPFPFGRAWFG